MKDQQGSFLITVIYREFRSMYKLRFFCFCRHALSSINYVMTRGTKKTAFLGRKQCVKFTAKELFHMQPEISYTILCEAHNYPEFIKLN